MARRRSLSTKAFLGPWKIVEMQLWDQDYIDLVVRGFIRFDAEGAEGMGEFQFGAVAGAIHPAYVLRDGGPCVEWTWEGEDEGDPRCRERDRRNYVVDGGLIKTT